MSLPRRPENLANTAKDNIFQISAYLDDKSLANFTSSCSLFYRQHKILRFWKERYIAAGCSEDLFKRLIASQQVQDLQYLYRVLTKLTRHSRDLITDLWELLLLSGEIPAIDYAIKEEKITAQTENKLGDNPLLCVALSGKVDSLKYLHEKLSTNPHSKNKCGCNVLHYASMGTVAEMKYAITELKINPNSRLKDGCSILHVAAKSGDIANFRFAVELLRKADKLKYALVNRNNMNILHAAAHGGNPTLLLEAKSLLEAENISLNSKTNKGCDVVDFALLSKDSATIELAKVIVSSILDTEVLPQVYR